MSIQRDPPVGAITTVGGVPVPVIDGTPSLPMYTGPIGANRLASGTAVDANTPLLATYGTVTAASYSVPLFGTVQIAIAVSASATLSVSHNASATTPAYNLLQAGADLVAGAEYVFAIPVWTGDVIDFMLSAAVTVTVCNVWFMPQQ
jgi:phosphoglycerol transferase MdoB-like AlkP superfamily enzyme